MTDTTTTTDVATAATEPAARQTVDGVRLTVSGGTLGHRGAGADPVLRGLELTVAPGELLTVVGPSGCGKSTLLRTLAGLLPPLRGTLSQDERSLTGPSADRALMFQDDALLPWRSLLRNVELPLAIRGVPRTKRRTQAQDWLARVGLRGYEKRWPHQVSGGQRQRAQLARALAGAPRALLMDEPFGALDAQTRAAMQQLLVDVVADSGTTVVFVTHDVDEALFLGDRVALLRSAPGDGEQPVRLYDVPRPRDRTAHEHPDTRALRRAVLDAL
ncbi:ABC transporter ATP-binding protein [Streptomyces ochraceiscleroticus]|uniref:ABC transporter ATP-binding protein n=1 Tax=Streptomyces ochraceiscleroticus TaxID=47761 RepID=A0ABW1MH12_9ACTN|nr:ABC transporter ATP-binding protein [Streptomyces ochraceiscleroticus]